MTEKTIINIAKDFSRHPAGRDKDDGPFPGEKFREKHLVPILQEGKTALIEFDGIRGAGSSFLEEAFGGLIRKGYTQQQVLSAFTFHSPRESYIIELKEYINDAAKAAEKVTAS